MKYAFSILVLFVPTVVFGYVSPGAPGGFVSDFAGMLTLEERSALESKLRQFEQESSNEISVATIVTLGGDTVENFAEKLFQEWEIGKKKQDNGVLVLVAKEDRKIRIEGVYGLEGALTDAQSFAIIDQIMKPAFRANDFYGGIDAAVDAIIKATKGEYVAQPRSALEQTVLGELLPFLLQIAFLVVFIWLSHFLGKSKEWWHGGVIGGVIGFVVMVLQGFALIGIAITAILICIGLLFDFIVSHRYQSGGHHGGPWFFGGGGFGKGGGGFGGGGSGGGGSSGGWYN